MGLDMYLERVNKNAFEHINKDLDEIKKTDPALYDSLKPYIKKRGSSYYSWDSLCEEVGYWRKANHIHNWFVENVQNGVDDCDSYEVSQESLEELKCICEQVIESSRTKTAKAKHKDQLTDDHWKEMLENEEALVDEAIANELLPTTSGFFFGSTQYDSWYLYDIQNTLKIIEDVMLTTDFDEEMILYASSW